MSGLFAEQISLGDALIGAVAALAVGVLTGVVFTFGRLELAMAIFKRMAKYDTADTLYLASIEGEFTAKARTPVPEPAAPAEHKKPRERITVQQLLAVAANVAGAVWTWLRPLLVAAARRLPGFPLPSKTMRSV